MTQTDDSIANSEVVRAQSTDFDDGLHSGELIVVGVGASAGGLEALQLLVANLDETSRMAFIVAQHVSADYKSMIVELLARHSKLEVISAYHGQILRPGKVYACPPGYHITISDRDMVVLTPVDETIFVTKPSIDLLFKSIAQAKGPRSIGIILSGTGTDGTSGVGAIKDVDGFSIAQTPNTAKYDGMPATAIRSGKVDLILAPDDIGVELASISPLADRPIPEFRTGENREAYEQILRLLKRDHGVNFSLYKDKTLSRRIMRRMIATKSPTISDYVELLDDSAELTELFFDLLIGVTEFFRDEDAYAALRVHLEEYIERKSEPYLRIWSVGCSTGEEPYSIAIMLAEMLGERLDDFRIQIFATDLNQRSVDRARRGRYSVSEVSGLPQHIRDTYFLFVDGHFEVVKRIKQMIVFSQHDVSNDPPFLRQDLVVCRNVMIYFGSDLQDSLLPAFHYVLHPGALLFLGQADSIGPHQALWEVVSSSEKIFRAMASVHSSVPRLVRNSQFTMSPPEQDKQLRAAPKRRIAAEMDEVVMQQLERMLAPNIVLLNSADKILYSHGDENVLLRRQAGLASDGVFDNIHPEMVLDLRTALHRLRSSDDVITTDFRRIEAAGETFWARLMLSTTMSSKLGDLVVMYCQVERALGAAVLEDGSMDDGSPALSIEHKKQVAKLREQLAIVMEQLDSSNEQMQALNEELQSSNEELQSSNEELETTNEELQSTNEELQTAYAELRIAFDEKANQELALEQTALELQNANELLVVAETVGVSGSWRWQTRSEELLWSPGLHRLFGTDPDTATPSFELLLDHVHHEDRPAVEQQVEQLLTGRTVDVIEFRLRKDSARWLSMRAAVEHGQYKSVRHIVGTLRDVTVDRAVRLRDEAQVKRIARYQEQVELVLNESVNGIYLFDFESNTNDFISDSYSALLGWTKEDIDEMGADEFVQLFHDDDRDDVFAHMATIAGLSAGEGRTIRYRFRHKEGHWVDVFGNDSVYEVDDDGRATKMLGTFFLVNDDAR